VENPLYRLSRTQFDFVSLHYEFKCRRRIRMVVRGFPSGMWVGQNSSGRNSSDTLQERRLVRGIIGIGTARKLSRVQSSRRGGGVARRFKFKTQKNAAVGRNSARYKPGKVKRTALTESGFAPSLAALPCRTASDITPPFDAALAITAVPEHSSGKLQDASSNTRGGARSHEEPLPASITSG